MTEVVGALIAYSRSPRQHESQTGVLDPPFARLRLLDLRNPFADSARSVSSVDDQSRMLGDKVPVIRRMVCRYQDTVLRRQVFRGQRFTGQTRHVVVSHGGQDGDVRVVVADDGSAFLK